MDENVVMPCTTIRSPWRLALPCAALTLSALLTGCDYLGIESTTQTDAKKDAEGKAIGAACRQAVRSIEACYGSNPKAAKAAVYDGWLQMDGYMRDNKLEGMPAPAAAPAVDSSVPANQAIGKSEEIVPPVAGDKKAATSKDKDKAKKS